MVLFETFQVFLSWPENMHVLLVYSWKYFLINFLGFEPSHFSNSNSIDSGHIVDASHPTILEGHFFLRSLQVFLSWSEDMPVLLLHSWINFYHIFVVLNLVMFFKYYKCAWIIGTLWMQLLLQLWTLTLSTLGKIFSRQHFEIFFLFFPENRIWHFMQMVS